MTTDAPKPPPYAISLDPLAHAVINASTQSPDHRAALAAAVATAFHIGAIQAHSGQLAAFIERGDEQAIRILVGQRAVRAAERVRQQLETDGKAAAAGYVEQAIDAIREDLGLAGG